MSKFHINKHGVPDPCKAKEGNCPLGGDGEHFSTEQEAQNYIDKKNEERFGTIPHELGYAGAKADEAIENAITSRDYDLNIYSIDENIIDGEYFDSGFHPRQRIVTFYREASRYDDLDTHSQALRELDDGRDAVEQVKKQDFSDPEERYEALTQAQALNDSYKEGTKLAFFLSKQTRRIAEKEGLNGDEYDELRRYVSDKLKDSLHDTNKSTSGKLYRGKTLKDNRIPTFYRLNDYPEETLAEDVNETGYDSYQHATWDNLDIDEKHQIFIDSVDKDYYYDAYNSQDESFIDFYTDDMINHYNVNGIASPEKSKEKIKDIGKRKFFEEFNDYVFYREKPNWS